MLKIITSLVMFLIGIAAQAQVENTNLAKVTKIKIKNKVELVYTQNATPMLTVDKQDEAFITTSVDGNTLTIVGKNNKNQVIKVYVSTARVESFKASSGAKITLTKPLETANLEVTLNTGAQFSGLTRTQNMKLFANYGTVFNGRSETQQFYGNFANAKVNLSGTASYSTIKANESTCIYAKNFVAENSSVKIINDSSIVIHGTKNMRFITDESAQVTYFGRPETVDTSNLTVATN